jgi:Tol biopolymer transport system component
MTFRRFRRTDGFTYAIGQIFGGVCPPGKKLLYDTYPNRKGVRTLYLFDVETDSPEVVGEFYAHPELDGEIRCDLHPRFNRAGSTVSFDSVHEGARHIYTFDV